MNDNDIWETNAKTFDTFAPLLMFKHKYDALHSFYTVIAT